MTPTLICPFCATPVPDTTCPTCQAQYGFKDGQGNIRTRNSFILLGLLSALFSTLCFLLASNIPLWYYYYPLMGFTVCLAFGACIVAVMVVRGERWWPGPHQDKTP